MNKRQFECFRDLVYDMTGVTIADSRKSMLYSRVSRRMRATQTNDFDAYLKLLLSNTGERELFIDKVTTHETRFFRTPRVWEYLDQTYIDTRLNAENSSEFAAWSAASSSGEEAYSLAMLLAQRPGARYRIDASDVSTEVVGKASQGRYQGRNVDRFREAQPEYFASGMEPDGQGFKIRERLKTNIRFFKHNLFDAPPQESTYDLVLLRNVLIYFTSEDQLRVLKRVEKSLKPGGVLIIGESEKLPPVLEDFLVIEPFIYAHATSTKGLLAANG